MQSYSLKDKQNILGECPGRARRFVRWEGRLVYVSTLEGWTMGWILKTIFCGCVYILV